jgi:hypothetical protein
MHRIPDQERSSAADLLVVLLQERKRREAADALTPTMDRHFRELCSLLLWKYSEASGKYQGCRYWSVGALASKKKHGRIVTSKLKYEGEALRHEHLYPRASQIAELFALSNPSVEVVQGRLQELNIGVVVTEAEHRLLPKEGNAAKPWTRYELAGVRCEPQNYAQHQDEADKATHG